MDTRRHHLRINEIEIMVWERDSTLVSLTTRLDSVSVPAIQVVHLQVKVVWDIFRLPWIYVDTKDLCLVSIYVLHIKAGLKF